MTPGNGAEVGATLRKHHRRPLKSKSYAEAVADMLCGYLGKFRRSARGTGVADIAVIPGD